MKGTHASRGLGVVVATFILLLVVSLAASWAAIYVVNATRAYSTGEGRYSKAEKIAVLDLYRFAYSGLDADFDAFRAAIAVPRGDRKARLALEGRPVDVDAAASGFLAGQNHPADVPAMITLFRVFSRWGPFAAAIRDWNEGDRLVGILVDEGNRLKELIDSGKLDATTRAQELTTIQRTDDRLTQLENTFSTHMGEAARAATRLVVIGLGGTMALLWVVGMAIAARLFRQQLILDRQLSSSEQRFRDYAEVASDWYWETDAEYRITQISEQFFALTQAALESVVGRPLEEFVSRYCDVPDADVRRVTVEERRPFRALRLCYPKDDGSLVYLSLSGKPQVDESGAFLGYRGIGSDITASVKEAELVQARRNAEAANQAKSSFVAAMSHEIRTPLNAIIGMTHLVARSDLAPRQRDFVEKIQNASRHLLAIVNDILDYSKIEAGHLALEKAEFDLEDMLAGVADVISERASAKGLEVVFDVEGEIQTDVVGDSLRLGQILINFANNAIKFTEQGEIDVVVRQTGQTETTVEFTFSVTDSGIGIAEDRQALLFQSFQQGDVGTARRYGGTGLGLAICKRLAELMGGRVGFESELGRGSTFWASVRLGKGKRRKPRSAVAQALREKRFLVVDDNANARGAIVEMLRSSGFTVESAADGVAAIAEVRSAIASKCRFDVVFVDWRMPQIDGLEMIRRVRALTSSPPAFVLVTAYGREEVLRLADQAGVSEILIKPVSRTTLFDAAVRALGEERATFDPLALSAREKLRGFKILVAEDNEMNQEVARELLASVGVDVDIAVDGNEAIARVKETKYDLVLMDLQMPIVDGLEATRTIRKDPAFSDLPIVAMTANAMESDRRACLDAGMNDHIGKPVDPEELFTVLEAWADRVRFEGNVEPIDRHSAGASLDEAFEIDPVLQQLAEVIDVRDGLERASQRGDFYRSILRQYSADERDAARKIRAALAAGDREQAVRVAHTSAGLGGQIGAAWVRGTGRALERTILNGGTDDEINVLLKRLDDAIRQIVEAIDAALPDRRRSPRQSALMQGGVVDQH